MQKHKNEYLDFLLAAVQEAGRISQHYLNRELLVQTKTAHSDLVTLVDREIEHFLTMKIKDAFPTHQIMGEETYKNETFATTDYIWIIDPIDGTTNFVHQKQNYAVSVGLYHEGEVLCGAVYDPTRQELFWAEKGHGAYLNETRLRLEQQLSLSDALFGAYFFYSEEERQNGFREALQHLAEKSHGLRIMGSASLELCYVAAGRLDAHLCSSLHPWDIAAGKLLVEEAGGVVTRLHGEPIDVLKTGGLLACHPMLLEEILPFTKRLYQPMRGL